MDPLPVKQHIADGQHQTDPQQQKPQTNPLPHTNACKACCDAGGKGIDCRAQHAGTGAQQNHAHGCDGIIPRCHHYRQQQRIKCNGFLGHAEGGPAQCKGTHENGNQHAASVAQLAYNGYNACIHCPGFAHDTQKAAHHQDKYRNLNGFVKALQRRFCHRPDALTAAAHLGIAARNGRAVLQIVILSRRKNPGQCSNN